MGFYLTEDSKGNKLGDFGKTKALLEDGAVRTDGAKFEPNLVCVKDCFTHDAAIYCYSEQEYNYVKESNKRNKDYVDWLIHPKAPELSNFK